MRPLNLAVLNRAFACWNWKCALMSATMRSLVVIVAMMRVGLRGSLAVVAVEMAYVTFTSGLYAGLQQRALGLPMRLLGNLTIVVGVPGLSLALDWLAHRAVGAAAPPRATLAVCVFALVSALFHLHVMRRGAFLTGEGERSLAEDFRRMPRLALEFAGWPVMLVSNLLGRAARVAGSEAVL